MTVEIEARGLIAVYPAAGAPVAALRGLDLTAMAGEILAVVGPSGSGKTTLLQLLGGSRRPTAGTLSVRGLALDRASPEAIRHHRRSVVATVDQHYRRALSPYLPAAEIVALGPAVRGVPAAARARRAAELLDLLGLSGRGDARLGELSGGEQQRVAVAAALAIRPRILLADEPTGELDAASTVELLALFGSVIRAEGATAVVVTHDPAVEAIADRVVVLEDGRAVALRDGPPGSPERPLVDTAGWQAPALTWRQRADASSGHAGDRVGRAGGAPGRRIAGSPPDVAPAIRLRSVTRRYGPTGHALTAIEGVDADVGGRGVHALTGPSGSGKSTLLRVVAGLDRPDAGTVEVFGTDLASLDRDGLAAFRARSIGVAEQARGLVPFLDVRENLALAATLHGRAAASANGHVSEDLEELLEVLGLAAVADRRPAELSAGERTRAAIGRALVRGPALLLLDEPTATLDRVSAARIAALLAELGGERAIFVATHDPALIAIADDRLDLRRGTPIEA